MLGYRQPAFKNAPLLSSLAVINKVLEMERLISEHRNVELHQHIYNLLSNQHSLTSTAATKGD